MYKSIVSAADSYVWLLERAFGEEYGLVMGVFLVCQSLGKKRAHRCYIVCMLYHMYADDFMLLSLHKLLGVSVSTGNELSL